MIPAPRWLPNELASYPDAHDGPSSTLASGRVAEKQGAEKPDQGQGFPDPGLWFGSLGLIATARASTRQ